MNYYTAFPDLCTLQKHVYARSPWEILKYSRVPVLKWLLQTDITSPYNKFDETSTRKLAISHSGRYQDTIRRWSVHWNAHHSPYSHTPLHCPTPPLEANSWTVYLNICHRLPPDRWAQFFGFISSSVIAGFDSCPGVCSCLRACGHPSLCLCPGRLSTPCCPTRALCVGPGPPCLSHLVSPTPFLRLLLHHHLLLLRVLVPDRPRG